MGQRKQIPNQPNAEEPKGKQPNQTLQRLAKVEMLQPTNEDERKQHPEISRAYRFWSVAHYSLSPSSDDAEALELARIFEVAEITLFATACWPGFLTPLFSKVSTS